MDVCDEKHLETTSVMDQCGNPPGIYSFSSIKIQGPVFFGECLHVLCGSCMCSVKLVPPQLQEQSLFSLSQSEDPIPLGHCGWLRDRCGIKSGPLRDRGKYLPRVSDRQLPRSFRHSQKRDPVFLWTMYHTDRGKACPGIATVSSEAWRCCQHTGGAEQKETKKFLLFCQCFILLKT